jgi:coenzyme PQQ precursor peptide PqqA
MGSRAAPWLSKSPFPRFQATAKRLISRHFEPNVVSCPLNFFASQHERAEVYATKIPLANFAIRDSLSVRAQVVRFKKESLMAWKTPKIVEVPVGMEINMYACAARK